MFCNRITQTWPMAGTFAIVFEPPKKDLELMNVEGLTHAVRELGSCPRRDWFATRGLHVAVIVFNHQVKPDRLLSNSAIRATVTRPAMKASPAVEVRAEFVTRRIRLCLGVARCSPA